MPKLDRSLGREKYDFLSTSILQKLGLSCPGILVAGSVFDMRLEMSLHAPSLTPYNSVDAILANWDSAKTLLTKISENPGSKATPLDRVTLNQPINNPGAIYCAAANYYDHAKEMGTDVNKKEIQPYFFIKSSSVVVGSGENIRLPANYSKKFDWEIEIAAVVGRETMDISETDALSCLAGYTIINDLSARDQHLREDWPFGTDWFEHKSFETSAPMGPWITPAEEIDDVQSLPTRTWINEEIKQDSNSAQMIFTIAEQISHLSRQLTLKPGDVIATSTCAGVGDFTNTFLMTGDHIRMEVEGLGMLENMVTERN